MPQSYIRPRVEVFTEYSLLSASYRFWLGVTGVKGVQSVAQPLVMSEVEEGREVKPTFELDPTRTQELFNQLWNAGFRPKDGTGSVGQLQATEDHLNDMRKIVFFNMGIKDAD